MDKTIRTLLKAALCSCCWNPPSGLEKITSGLGSVAGRECGGRTASVEGITGIMTGVAVQPVEIGGRRIGVGIGCSSASPLRTATTARFPEPDRAGRRPARRWPTGIRLWHPPLPRRRRCPPRDGDRTRSDTRWFPDLRLPDGAAEWSVGLLRSAVPWPLGRTSGSPPTDHAELGVTVEQHGPLSRPAPSVRSRPDSSEAANGLCGLTMRQIDGSGAGVGGPPTLRCHRNHRELMNRAGPALKKSKRRIATNGQFRR